MRLSTLLVAIGIGLAGYAHSAEVFAPNLKLRATYLKSTDIPMLPVSTTPANAFTPTPILCSGPCILSIEVAVQVAGLNPPDPNAVAAIVLVDNSTAAVLPNAVLGLDSTSTGGGSNARYFRWMTRELQSGSHSVQVQLFVPKGGAVSPNRTLKIDVYRFSAASDDSEDRDSR